MSQSFAILFIIIIILKNPLKTKSIVKKNVPMFVWKQNKNPTLIGSPYLLKPFVFPKMP